MGEIIKIPSHLELLGNYSLVSSDQTSTNTLEIIIEIFRIVDVVYFSYKIPR